MDTSKLSRGELIAVAGGGLLLIGVFLKWYASVSPNAEIGGVMGVGTYSCWDVHSIMRILLVLAAVAPIVLAYVILRDHQLSWPRGEATAVIAIIAIGLIFYNGVVDRPGDPSGEIELRLGWYISFVGALAMLAGSVMRQQQSEIRRNPPGVM
ncbi:hypothetical protein DSM112329_04032 [Paraconexibacter sp. AEG42_29]|uniref:DUF4293 family protein n=1 Tax=Paraconexibacter sp. AEG42_29 TaxID=2997339 RepID=A0AAU7AZK2_9ACTN